MPTITSGLMRLGRDAELRHLPSGQPVVSLSLAYSYGKKDEASGKRPTQWIEAAFWGDYAAKAAPNLLKGMLIHAVLEDVHSENYKSRDGSPGFKLCARMQSFDYAAPRDTHDTHNPPPRPSATPASSAPKPTRPTAPNASGFDDMDDDIPF